MKKIISIIIISFLLASNIFAGGFKKGSCPVDLTLHQNLNAPWPGQRYIKNGRYNKYTKGIVKEADILQKHLNRLGFNAGKVDGIIGPKTRAAILRLQKYLGTKADGYVGPKTRALLNNSCGTLKKNKNIIFKSNFEKGVCIENPVADEGGIWWQNIKGSDIDGFSWPININEKGSLQLIIDSKKDIKKYISNSIEEVYDNNGNITHALHQNILKKQYGYTQDPYIIYTEGKEVEDLYIKYSMKLPEDINSLLDDDGYIVLTEYKTTGDYRLAFYIYKDKDKKLYWYVHGDNVVDEPEENKEFWYRENYKVPVPVGKWFDMELFWHRSKKNDGNVWWAIDGKTIVDYNGPTKIKDPINAIMVFTNYASNPIHQWIDNIEVGRGFPCGYKKSCIKK